MMSKSFEEFYSELNSMSTQDIKNALEEASKNLEKCTEPFEARDIIKQQQETIESQKAEIERLEIKIEGVQEANAILREHIKKAIKEFADLAIKRICENVTPIPQQRYLIKMCIEEIENTKKEMVGETND